MRDRIKVLYIEDDEVQRETFGPRLRSKGFQVVAAASGTEGLRALKRKKPNVILCDLNMPEMSGLEVLQKVRSIDKEIPFIILTAHGSVDQAVFAIRQGAYDFVLKPLEINKIETTIYKAQEKVNLVKELARTESSLRMIMENVPDVIYSLNPQGEFLSVSPAADAMFGYTPAEMLGTSVFDYIYSEDRERVQAGFNRAMRMGERLVRTIEFRMTCKSGEVKHCEVNRRLIFENGEVIRQDGIIRDVSERKRLEEELQKYSEELEQRVEERTKSLEYATRQLAALNAVSNRFTLIYHEEELIKEASSLLCHSLDFDRASLFLHEGRKLTLGSFSMEKDPPELVENFLHQVRMNEFEMAPHLEESFADNRTIFIPDLNADPRWPREAGQTVIPTKAVVVSPIRVHKKPIGVMVGNMQYHERDMDTQDVARFEMFANMVGLALDNIRAYQTLERKIIEKTQSLRDTNRQLRRKAKELENNTYSLGNANVELLAVQEQLEKKNHEMAKLLQELSASEAKNRALLNAIPDLMFQISRDGRVLEYKDSGGMGTGVPSEQSVVERITDILPTELAGQTLRFVEKALATQKVQIFEYQLPFNGEVHDYEARMVVSRENSVLVIVRDITERKQAEEKIATRLRYEEGLAACSRTLLAGRDDQDALNEAMRHLLRAADIGRVYILKNIEDKEDGLCLCRTHEVCAPGVKQEIADPQSRHIPYRAGFQRWRERLGKGVPLHGIVAAFPKKERDRLESHGILSILVLPINVGNSWYGLVGFDDMNKQRDWGQEDIRLLQTAAEMIGGYIEHRQAEEALKASEERFRNLVENANDIIYSLTPEGIFLYVSPNWKDILGYEVSEALGKSLEIFVHPEDLAECNEFLRKVVETGEKQSSIEYRMKHKDGSWRWHTSSASPLKDRDGNVQSFIGIAHDVTERKKYHDELTEANRHLREAQAQLVQSEKMASLGMLVAGIAHEINTPIGAVHSMHDTLKRAVKKLRQTLETEYEKDLQENRGLSTPLRIIEDANKVIDSGSERVIEIVRRLRSFARLDEAELKKIDIHEGLEDTLTLIHHEIKHNIQVTKHYAELPAIACFPGQLNQVFLNLLINAKQAIKDKGEVTITTFKKQNKVHIVIQDTGVGIPKNKLAKIFDPGFTTKGVGVGTGLGLSIVYNIIEEHKGTIRVDSEVGKGTTFTIVFPMNLDELLERT